MKTTKINKGYYKGTYKGYNFIVTTSYDWREFYKIGLVKLMLMDLRR